MTDRIPYGAPPRVYQTFVVEAPTPRGPPLVTLRDEATRGVWRLTREQALALGEALCRAAQEIPPERSCL